MKTLWASIVGSHACGMQRPDSDIDINEIVIDSAFDFFTGNGMSKNIEIHENSLLKQEKTIRARCDARINAIKKNSVPKNWGIVDEGE